jgi:uncharacterized protein YcbK (DUF882 family)
MPNSDPPRKNNRRRFLAGIGAYGLVGLAGTVARARADAPAASDRRTIRLVHTHTGEQLTAPYFAAGRYQLDCLERVNHLLRDFRTGEVHPIDPTLLDLLFSLQGLSACEAPYAVISGYRSPATNAMLRRTSEGVAQHSMHLQGRAIDVRLPGYSTHRLGELARQLGRGGVGYYRASDFVHVDTGRVRFW